MSGVLFVCVHNAGRSQMAGALFQQAARGRHEARSAGTQPAARVHLEVVEAMDEAEWELRGPVGRLRDEVRATCEEIRQRVEDLLRVLP